jgi:hypothetical protein
MAFMIPQYTREPFHVGENKYGERVVAPTDLFGTPSEFARQCDVLLDTVEVVAGKWWVWLSAPGYMDCTDWDGPFDTEQAARDHIEEWFEVDPDTGDDLEFENEGDSNG